MFINAILQVSPLLFGGISGLTTRKEIDSWYSKLNAPAIKPPNYLFGPVWTTLYLMMGYASTIIYKSDHPLKTQALSVYIAQLLLNIMWTPIFFGKHNLSAALVNIVALDVTVLYTIKLFLDVDVTAGYLLLPYMAWISFATVLNFEFLRLNKDKK